MKTIEWTSEGVVILDQSRLPNELIYETLSTVEDVADAIKTLKLRGAPLIGVAAAMGMALAAAKYCGGSEAFAVEWQRAHDMLLATRPTAVNLQWALWEMDRVYRENSDSSIDALKIIILDKAQRMLQDDVLANEDIGRNGEQLIKPGSKILTVCNAGALATCGYGTALGVIRSAHNADKVEKVYACETRPVLQGSRLTVWELTQDGIPVTLITDNMAGYLMSLGEVDAVITGADRIAANGDTANKIGTYMLAILANYHSIPFYVAAPMSTIDPKIHSGKDIPIETRDPEEVRMVAKNYITVPDVPVFNPAFDVTPNHLITAIITEKGILREPYTVSLINMLDI
ncbi:MAG: S-methyl-5-thioribose-1-phosphate isomerase [Acidobacteriota bacterium]